MLEAPHTTGRRIALHEYPYRDDVFVEDLGLGVRAFTLRAFIVGDDVYSQRDALKAASEIPGPGLLVHPSLGSLNVSLIPPFTMRETAENGRVVELEFTFIQTAQPLYPTAVGSTQATVSTTADSALGSIGTDFTNTIGPALANGAEVVEKGAVTTGIWTANAESLSGSASLLVHAVAGLQGNYGRYSNGALGVPQDATATVATLLASVTTARTAVVVAGAAANGLASGPLNIFAALKVGVSLDLGWRDTWSLEAAR